MALIRPFGWRGMKGSSPLPEHPMSVISLCLWFISRTKEYATLKVCIQAHDGDSSRILNEVNMLRRLEKFAKDFADDDHPGPDFTRLAKDIFQVNGPTGSHYCIVSKPQGHDVRFIRKMLTWDQDVRISANNAIMDKWLNWPISNKKMVDSNFGAALS
ncbi:hypothetical protein BDW69DRAFT_161200 [Aspergillus filifer]